MCNDLLDGLLMAAAHQRVSFAQLPRSQIYHRVELAGRPVEFVSNEPGGRMYHLDHVKMHCTR